MNIVITALIALVVVGLATLAAWSWRRMSLRKRLWSRIAELRGWKLKSVMVGRRKPRATRAKELLLATPVMPPVPNVETARLTVEIDARPKAQEIPRVVSILRELEEELSGLEVKYQGRSVVLEGPWTKLADDQEGIEETVNAIEDAVSEVRLTCLRAG